MKLIEILVQELPARGGWPKGIHALVQSSQGSIYKAGGGFPFLISKIAEDWELAEVTRYQYDAALAQAQWNGEGLPPVGSLVEVTAEDFEGGWHAIEVVYVHNGEVIGIVKSDNEYLNDRLEKFSAGYNRAEFRPIRSEADKKKYASIEKMLSVFFGSPPSDEPNENDRVAMSDLYDAIAAGNIPNIRIA